MDSHDERTLRNAMTAHSAGRLTEAKAGYQRVLRGRPTDPHALYGLGLLSFHAGAVDTAIEYVARCVKHAPRNSRAWITLGSMYMAAGNTASAKNAYQRATEVAPELSDGWYNLGICLRGEGDLDGTIARLRKATQCNPPNSQAHDALASLLYQQGQMREAAAVFVNWANLDPENPKALHMAAAASGRDPPSRASDGYVRAHFDAAATGFDRNLEQLRYLAPQFVATALRDSAAETVLPAVLDAGCGTGLCGPVLRPLCRTLVGVDLSPKMLAYAGARNCYDELVTAELSAFMRSRVESFDAVICVDTFVYFGALEEPLGAAHAALRGAGLLIFTVEALSDNDVSDFRLDLSGRYAHSEGYLRRALNTSGFSVESVSRETLREEHSEGVVGYVVVARRS